MGPTNPSTLLWDAPTTNADGTPLTDLAGYRVYLSQSQAGPWTQVASTPVGTTQSSVSSWGTLAPGQYFTTVTAVDTTGNVSAQATPIPFAVGDVVAPSSPVNLRFQ